MSEDTRRDDFLSKVLDDDMTPEDRENGRLCVDLRLEVFKDVRAKLAALPVPHADVDETIGWIIRDLTDVRARGVEYLDGYRPDGWVQP